MARSPALLALSFVCAAAACGSSAGGLATDGGVADSPAIPVDAIKAPTTCDDAATSCDPFLSCGCTPTEKCTAADTGLTCQVAGSMPVGAACTDDTTCARGTICVAYAGPTTCHAFCDLAHACGGGACYIIAADRAGTPVGKLCGPSCSLLGEDCPAGFACYPADQATDADHGICLTAGVGTQGAPCAGGADCAKGYGCIDPSGSSPPICAKICGLKGGQPSCDSGSCRAFASSSADSQTGVCLP